jgi:3-isopropylmalate/(R)-2-methylmalate dehydratase small subunit
MDKFVRLEGLVAPLDRANVDTDAIIPKQFLKSIKRSGFGPNAVRRMALPGRRPAGQDNSQRAAEPGLRAQPAALPGRADPAHARELRLRQLARARALGAARFRLPRRDRPSFADIFFNNCFKNGILPIVLPATEVDALFALVETTPGCRFDLEAQQVVCPDGRTLAFVVDPFRRECLLNGWDDIGLTLRHADRIRAFEEKRRLAQPWLFAEGSA